MISHWRDDADKSLRLRVNHLLGKTWPDLRFVWAVGNCVDDTYAQLQALTADDRRVTLIPFDSDVTDDDPDSRLVRLSQVVNAELAQIRPDDDYVLIHESDLVSPPDLIQMLFETGQCPVAGWPVLPLPDGTIFYDTWAYRKDGRMFSNQAPYHPCYKPYDIFEVDSAGSVLLFHAEDVRRGLRCERRAVLELCHKMKADFGRRIWVDPLIEIIQPVERWTAREHASA